MMDLFMCNMLLLFVSHNMRCCIIYYERVDCGFYILSVVSMDVNAIASQRLVLDAYQGNYFLSSKRKY